MLFYSTNLKSPSVSFREALLQGQAPDKGLYMPETIPQVSSELLQRLPGMDYHKIACELMYPFMMEDIGKETLAAITKDAYDFQVPLEHVYDRKYVMRLDQGPTASFKDFAARMMGRLINHFLQQNNQKLLILTATSGDTGSAIAHAFYGLDSIRVLVLFPEAEVTNRQRKQMTTLGKNIGVVALDGKFDDCQALVKQAFSDPDLNYLCLSSANFINICRLIPQMVYYFYAWSRLAKAGEKATFCVPSGNFGDMMGGMLAVQMGLPVHRFIIAVNDNDEFPKYLSSGAYQKIEPSRNCISSAMNVGHPSNLARLVALYGGNMDEKGIIHRQADMEKMQRELWSVAVDDQHTRNTIREAWEKNRLLLEPHGAVGWAGLHSYLGQYTGDHAEELFVSLETAHPAKFPEEINRLLGFDPELPPSLMHLEDKTEMYEKIPTDYQGFKKFLTENYRG
jgi:threonine synthase